MFLNHETFRKYSRTSFSVFFADNTPLFVFLRSWMISWVQATDEIIRLLGLHDNYSSLSEPERMTLLAEVISSPPPVEKVEVCLFLTILSPSLCRSSKVDMIAQADVHSLQGLISFWLLLCVQTML